MTKKVTTVMILDSGWNLPPGCQVNDIPGNRPEDVLRDRIEDEVADSWSNGGVPEEACVGCEYKIQADCDGQKRFNDNDYCPGFIEEVERRILDAKGGV